MNTDFVQRREQPSYILPVAAMMLALFSLFISFFVLKNLVAGFFAYYILSCAAIPLLDLLLLNKKRFREIPGYTGLVPVHGKALFLGLFTGIGMAAVIILAFHFMKDIFLQDNRILASLKLWGVPAGHVILVCVVMLLVNGALEELFWRGYIYAKLKPMKNRPMAVGLPAIFFCGQHFFVISSIFKNPLAILLCMFGIGSAGLIWGIMRERDAGLLAPLTSHMLVTAGYLSVFYFFVAA